MQVVLYNGRKMIVVIVLYLMWPKITTIFVWQMLQKTEQQK